MSNFLRNAGILSLGYFAAKSLYRSIQHKRYSFYGKVVVLTGGSRGLGLVMARQLVQEGAYLCICARDEQELSLARMELEDLGGHVLMVTCDITDPKAPAYLIEQAVQAYGRIDVLINNAGQMVVGPYMSMVEQDFDRMMHLYFYAPLRLIEAALPYLRQHGQGRILNISSIGGKVSVPHLLPYCAAKFALTGLSEGLYASLKEEGVLVTTACPGLMRTGSPRNADVVGNHEQEYRIFKISDSLPPLAIEAERAAHKLLNACRRGDPEYILTVPAKLASLIHGISPSTVIRINELINRWMLPQGTENKWAIKGYETQYEKDGDPLTQLTDQAAAKNNEYTHEYSQKRASGQRNNDAPSSL
ncbi:SDR family NAD(P)-dependent oxidoreductase [Cesiribacter andamanensis]|uniref:Fatty acyl-CoA reductase n=1 Tax=Cesiribacter andamanensis AMV16 TaxID=1279009 RepID=M7NKC1_9BACT|nr:SDR family oxidoreductase [Cesiribacter andamanensis]EMR02220.1 Fatty acyl-CoA reductase [Cesiribacter andamanensis AMV16]